MKKQTMTVVILDQNGRAIERQSGFKTLKEFYDYIRNMYPDWRDKYNFEIYYD